ncbi:hypothetical protein ACFLUS_03060 [Chloroflexota bacterium]
MLRIFLLVAGISLAASIISIFLHNAIYGLVYVKILNRPDLDEPVFFVITLFMSLVAFPVGIIGSLVIFIKGLFTRSPERQE